MEDARTTACSRLSRLHAPQSSPVYTGDLINSLSHKEQREPDVPARVGSPVYGGSFTTSSGETLPFVLPGEVVHGTSILQPSPARVPPHCQHFGACGGCHYQHAAYPAQLSLKREILQQLFASAGLAIPALQLESAGPYHYRNRIRLRLEPDATGALQVGYSRRQTNLFLPIRMCPIAAPLLWRAAGTLLTLAATDPLVARWLANTSELELFCTPDESRLQLQFLLRSADAARRESSSFPGFCERLNAAVPELSGAGALLDPELNRRTRRLWPGAAWGAAGLAYPVDGRTYWLPRGAFFQVNRFLVDRLVDLVTSGRSGVLAWDLYAGVGLFTRALAERFSRVVAVEGAEAAAASLQALSRKQTQVEPIHSSTLDFLRARVIEREHPSLIVCDPPRAGLGAEAARLLARIAAPEVVYVSCDPTTLARDLALLTERTYTIESVTLIDLFPQTFHIETIVTLRHNPG